MKRDSENRFDYDTFINWTLTTKCNFNCDYCFNKLETSPPIKPVNIKKVIKTLRKTNRKFLITFSGGEPFLIPNFIELCEAITKEHYISICTNLSCTDEIKKFVKEISPERVKSIHASCHILEHKKRGMSNFFIENYNLLKKNNFFIDAGYVIYPPLLSRFEKDILYYRSKGIKMYGREFIGYYKNKKYPESYDKKDKKRILKYYTIGKSYLKGTSCNAGYNAAAIYPTGKVLVCYFLPLKLGNIYKKIKFNKKMLICPLESCQCPLKLFEPQLFSSACKQTTCYSPKQQEALLKNLEPKKIFFRVINPDKIIGQIGLLIKKINPNLYIKLKK